VEKAIEDTVALRKPIGALCISPAILAKVLKDVNVTIGKDKGTAEAIEAMGATHVETDHGDVVFDENKLVFTTPCYMLDATITDIDDGATNVVKEMMKVMS
jgi:enhancing lycopene biosynthesis protein 2